MKVSITYKYKEKDKVNVSVTYDDLWKGDVTLARVIYPFLKKYRKMYDRNNGHCPGYPMAFSADPGREEGPDNPDRFDEWLQCLDKMVYSFEWIAKNHDWDGPAEKEFHKECSKLRKAHKKELKKLAQQDLAFNREMEIMHPAYEVFGPQFEMHRQKVQEGIDLFAKYFGSLWL